jgi:hypothetical protein
MGIKLTNNANATLAAGINSSATSITLTSGQGARFPTLTASDYFYATLIDTSNNLEIVKCTARSTDVLTVVRAQESTTARAYNTGDRIEIRLTAQTFIDAVNEIGPTQVSDEANSSTGYFALPSGTTAQRPGSPTGNMIRKNTTTGYIEYYDPGTSSWIGIGSFVASGGTETTYSSGGVDYKVHTFTTSGTFQVLQGTKTVDYLIIAGGGAGGGGTYNSGGGGAGGYITGSLSANVQGYTVTIGAGGSGSTGLGANGANSSAFGVTAIGGGGGGQHPGGTINGQNGGSGGGGSQGDSNGGSGTAGQGNNGGGAWYAAGAGGGGAGAAGAVGPRGTTVATQAQISGGVGLASAINGTSTFRAGGGGGGARSGYGLPTPGSGGNGGGGAGGPDPGNGVAGTANTGGGGGGSGGNDTNTRSGGSGGSGIVIIRYTL